jgi:hypothetical protein
LWNKLPSDGRSNVGVSVLLEGWLPWRLQSKNSFRKYGFA